MDNRRDSFEALVDSLLCGDADAATSPDAALGIVSAQAEQRAQIFSNMASIDAKQILRVLDGMFLWGAVCIRTYAAREGQGEITLGIVHALVDLCARAKAGRELWYRTYVEGTGNAIESRLALTDTVREVLGEVVKVAKILEHDISAPMGVDQLMREAAIVFSA